MNNHLKCYTADDLRGRSTISYLRFSSAPQEKGTSIERQQETLDRIIAHYGLVLDHALTDKALSASKGDHRKRGQLGDLLTAIDKGVIKQGVVLTIEATDRLFREGLFDVFPVLAKLIRKGGMILVTGDMTIWDEPAINSQMNHKLIGELNGARAYTKRLGEMSAGAHASTRRKLEALAVDPKAPAPMLNARPPGWLVRAGTGYALHPDHAETVRLIFQMCLEGNSAYQIAAKFNEQKIPLLGLTEAREWRTSRIAELLRDEKVLGFVQPKVRDGNGRKPIGQRAKLYPHAIESDTWVKVRELLTARRVTLTGQRGKLVSNLFTGRVFCETCNGPMKADNGGGLLASGKRQVRWVCSGAAESSSCTDRRRFDISHYELPILMAIIEHSTLAPRTATHDVKRATEQLAGMRIEMAGLDSGMAALAPRIGSSPMLLNQFEKMGRDHDALAKQANALEIVVAGAATGGRRDDDVWTFAKALIGPAVGGDVDARERLRSLLSRVDFRLTGATPGMVLTIGGQEVQIDPPGFNLDRDADEHGAIEEEAA